MQRTAAGSKGLGNSNGDRVEKERSGEWRSHCDWRAICHLAEKEKILSEWAALRYSIPALTIQAKGVTLLREVIAPRMSFWKPEKLRSLYSEKQQSWIMYPREILMKLISSRVLHTYSVHPLYSTILGYIQYEVNFIVVLTATLCIKCCMVSQPTYKVYFCRTKF